MDVDFSAEEVADINGRSRERWVIKEERFLPVWVALVQARDPGVSLYHSIPLSFPLPASPGGLHHLIWINEDADLRLVFSLSPDLSREEHIVFSLHISVSV